MRFIWWQSSGWHVPARSVVGYRNARKLIMNKASKSSLRSRIIDFNRNFLDPNTPVSCLGTGELGGKAEGLVFIRDFLHSNLDRDEFSGIKIEIPSMAILCTDVFDTFMNQNQLYDTAYADL